MIEPAGDRAFAIRFGDAISPEVNNAVAAMLTLLDRARFPWVVDLVPAYATLLVVYDAVQVESGDVRGALEAAVASWRATGDEPSRDRGRLVTIPVWYDPRVAPDLEALAAEKTLTVAEITALHAESEYRVYALGFRPGFPFMGVVDPRLATPRHATPRTRVAAGSVGIAGRQTGIYPTEGPGGWRIVGRTPLAVFDIARANPFLLSPGDRVRFVAIDEREYLAHSKGPQR